jgi:hypothetical protein
MLIKITSIHFEAIFMSIIQHGTIFTHMQVGTDYCHSSLFFHMRNQLAGDYANLSTVH